MKNDSEIQRAIQGQLEWEPFIDASKIHAIVKNGFVTLTGQVDTNSMKILVERAVNKVSEVRLLARNYPGVHFVSNLITVKPKNTSEDLKEKVYSALQKSKIDTTNIKVRVMGRMVTLTGKIRSATQIKDVEDTAWLVPGVTSVPGTKYLTL